MHRFTPSILVAGATAGSLALATGFTANASVQAGHAEHATTAHYLTSGTAFGSRLRAASVLSSDDSARTTVGCGTHEANRQNTTAHTDISTVGVVHGVRTSAETTRTEVGPRTVTTARTTGSTLLGGLVRFTDLTSTATAQPSANDSPTSGDTRFYGLQINGHATKRDPAANTTYTVPGLANVILNAQRRTSHDGTDRITVDGMDLTLLRDSQFGDKGTTMVIGRATAALHTLRTSPLSGLASGSTITTAGVVTSNPTYQAKIPCTQPQAGESEFGAGINLDKVLDTGAVHTTSDGDVNAEPTSTTQATVNDVDLLGGVVTASVVRAHATASQAIGGIKRSGAGTHVADLRIAGKRVKVGDTPNQKFPVPGVGTLLVNRVNKNPRGVQVHGLELRVANPRDGLKKGAVLDIANAHSRIGY